MKQQKNKQFTIKIIIAAASDSDNFTYVLSNNVTHIMTISYIQNISIYAQ